MRIIVSSGDPIEPAVKTLATKSHHFVLSTQDVIVGGMAKWPDHTHPDPLHTYLGLSGMSLFLDSEDNYNGLLPVDASLNITKRAAEHLRTIHSKIGDKL